ncbi:NodT family efflux transporter outer membrane factor (OMF) lipoprotein [Kushneria sinocarnis]|uniref:NodT family efflux transporter outer membrane factor (OMF) lipoprotein n=1 Tax=Kushneria sinocarnis TaxID=595502 RepID=A0A420WUA3_9GAMM|nr:efflux transporter outer membrane subunit [Kushneria sinocarnis]RKQ97026.1 NodT family efflux transporter outer membrane factor (OMF) lipoprotein [Kushneria sinocarnis]
MGIAVITLLGGCANYAGIKPQGELTRLSHLSIEQAVGNSPITPAAWPDRQWWKALGDPTLDELIREALANSPDIDVAQARLRSANAAIGTAHSQLFPSIDASAEVSRSRVSEVEDPQGVGNYRSTTRALTTSLDFDFDLWGGDRAGWSAALGEARAQEVDYRAAALTLSVNVARRYVSLANAYAVRDVARRQLKRARRINRINQELHQAGLSNRTQSLQSQVTVSSAQQSLESAEQSIRSNRISLAILLGKGPDRGSSIPRPEPLSPALMALPSVVPAELIGHRPDVVAARWRVEAASQRIQQAKAQFYPNLNLTAMAGFRSALGSYFFEDAAKSRSVTPAISLPIFQGGRLRANLDSTEADYDLAVAQYNQTVLSALGEVTRNITDLQSIAQQRKQQQQALESARNAFNLALERYRSGIADYVTVLSSEQQLLSAEQTLANLRTRQVDQSVQLVQALGGGLQLDASVPHYDAGGLLDAPNPEMINRDSDGSSG